MSRTLTVFCGTDHLSGPIYIDYFVIFFIVNVYERCLVVSILEGLIYE